MFGETGSVKDYYTTNFRTEFTICITAINQWQNLSRDLIEFELKYSSNQISAIESELGLIENYLAECSLIGDELPPPDKYWRANNPQEDYRYGCASLDLYAYDLQNQKKLYELSVFIYCVQKQQELKNRYLEYKVKAVMASTDLGIAPTRLDLQVVENYLKQTLQQTFRYSTVTNTDIIQDYLRYCQTKIATCEILLRYIYQNKSILENINTLLIKAGALIIMEMFGEAETMLYEIFQEFEDSGLMIESENVYYDVMDMLVKSLIGQHKHSQAFKVVESAIELTEFQKIFHGDSNSCQITICALKTKLIGILLNEFANQADDPKNEILEQAATIMDEIINFISPIVMATLESYHYEQQLFDNQIGEQFDQYLKYFSTGRIDQELLLPSFDYSQTAFSKTLLSIINSGLCKEVLILFNKLRVFHPSYQPKQNFADYLFEESNNLIPQTELSIKRDFLQAYLLMDKNPTSCRQIYRRYVIADDDYNNDDYILTTPEDSNTLDQQPPITVKSAADFENYYAYTNLAQLGILNCDLNELVNTHQEKSLNESNQIRLNLLKKIQEFKDETLFPTSITLSQKDISMLRFIDNLNELIKELESANFDPKSKVISAFINICKKRLVLDL